MRRVSRVTAGSTLPPHAPSRVAGALAPRQCPPRRSPHAARRRPRHGARASTGCREHRSPAGRRDAARAAARRRQTAVRARRHADRRARQRHPVRGGPEGRSRLLPQRPQGGGELGERARGAGRDGQLPRRLLEPLRGLVAGARRARGERAAGSLSALARRSFASCTRTSVPGRADESVRAAAVRARRAPLRGAADGRVRRRHGPGAGRLPQDDGPRTDPLRGHAGVRSARRGEGSFHVRYRSDGRHVEANLTKQVLAEIEPGGHVSRIYTTSSGKPSTPTVIGRFRVYVKTPGENSEGMVDSNYFIRGYAIHGYAEVPDLCGQPRLPAGADPRRAGDLRVGAGGHAGRRLQRGRRRQLARARERRPVAASRRALRPLDRAAPAR